MLIAVVVLSLILLAVLIKYSLYRRQIKDICRQLSFLISHDTNILAVTSIKETEITELAILINDICQNTKNEKAAIIRKDRQLKEALANVSHDIRTPLTSLKGYFELLRNEENTEKQLQYAAVMEERMDNLTELLDELFSFTRMQNDDYVLELEKMNLTKPLLDTLFSFYEIINKKQIEPELDFFDGALMIDGNELAVKRIVSNIIKNALLHGDGELKIKYREEKDEKNKSWACFECANSVAEPDEIDVTQIFERFYKADKARSRQSTGLGLAIAKAYADKMNGTIEAFLEGNIFTIRVCLPLV